MSEEIKPKENAPTATETNTSTGSVSSTDSLVERADSIAKRVEEANKQAGEYLKRMEEIVTRNLLSGRADAGQPTKTPEQERQDKIAAEAKAIADRFKR